MVLHIDEIREDYNKGLYKYKGPIGHDKMYLPVDYVFDENLSVKRNREMVKEHNDEVERAKLVAREKQAELDRKLTEDVVAYIREYYDLDDRQAHIVEGFVYREKHSFMCDYFSSVDTFAEFADMLVNPSEE
jgi:hypothetical protein